MGRMSVRLTVLAAVVGLAMLGVGMTAGHFAGSAVSTLTTSGPPDKPVPCPNSTTSCFSAVRFHDVLELVRARGFACTETSPGGQLKVDDCQLPVGLSQYEVGITSPEGTEIEDLEVSATFDKDAPPSQHALDFMSWFAELPFPDDARSQAAAKAWLDQRLSTGGDFQARVNGYRYRVKVTRSGFFQFEIDVAYIP